MIKQYGLNRSLSMLCKSIKKSYFLVKGYLREDIALLFFLKMSN